MDSIYLIGSFRAPDKQTIITGSYEVDRDFHALHDQVFDPDGDKAYAIASRGAYVETRMCRCAAHRGERWIPATEFVGNDDICLGCRRRMGETERQVRAGQGKPAQFWRRLREETGT